MTGRLLHVAERHSGVQRGGDEGVSHRVRSDSLGDPGATGDTPHDAGGPVTIKSLSVAGEQDWSFEAFTDDEVDRPRGAWRERDGDGLAALAQHDQRAVA